MQVRDRFNLTRQALESLASSGLEGMTVTVLDDRSLDNTRDLVVTWSREHKAKYIRNDQPLGTGQLRNMVMEESRKHFGKGDYIAPHDNDTFYKPGWMQRLVTCYEATQVWKVAIIGAYGHPYHIPSAEWLEVLDPITKKDVFKVREVQALATQSMFMAWDVWDRYGPFCDTPIDKTCQSEDVDFTNRIRKDGSRLGVVYPHLIHATALKNTFGEPGPGWELVKAECPPGVLCE